MKKTKKRSAHVKFTVKTKHDRHQDRLTSELILVEKGTYHRFKIGGCPKGSEGRKEFGGEMIPGPWHYIFGLATVIAANPESGTYGEMKRARAENRVLEVADGDRIKIDGLTYTFKKTWNGVLDIE